MRLAPLSLLLAVAVAGCGAAPRVAVGAPAPDFEAIDLATGATVSLARDYRGQVTLVNVWATWCGPCREEIPSLQELYRELGPRGLRIAAVSIDADSAERVQAFMDSFGVTFDVLHDPVNTIQERYRSEKVPESFLIARDGRIVKIEYGAREWHSDGMRRLVAALLDDPIAGAPQ